MTKAEKAEQYFRDAVSDAMAYMSEAKTACGADMQQLEYYDLAAKALRRTAEDDKAYPCKVGDMVYMACSDEGKQYA